MTNDYDRPKKWTEREIRQFARQVCYNREACKESEWEKFIKLEVRSYISPGDVIKMVETLADALGYEIHKVGPGFEAKEKAVRGPMVTRDDIIVMVDTVIGKSECPSLGKPEARFYLANKFREAGVSVIG